jgi:hypothetical protein
MGTTTSDLISSIKIKGSFPTANDLFSTNDYLSILNDEMLNQIVPLLAKVQEEYFLAYKDYSVAVGQELYRIPKRATGSSLRSIQLISSTGSVVPLQRLFEEDKTSLNGSGANGYYLRSNQVAVSPVPTAATDTLRLAYFRRPSKFVTPSACAQITAINGNIVTVASAPVTFANGILIDLVQGDTPYDLLSMDLPIASISGTTLTFTSVPTDLAIGDYVSLAGQACVPMVPEELVPLLVQAALCICLTSKKDMSAQLELQKLQAMTESSLALLEPRVRSNDQKIKSSGLLGYFRGNW